MENQALQYLKGMLDKANQSGVFNLSEAANVIAALEELNKFINKDQIIDHGKEEN